MIKKKRIKQLKAFLPLCLGVFFILFSYFEFTPAERARLLENIVQVEPIWIIISLVGGFLSHLSRAYRWKLLIKPLGYSLRFSTGIMAVMAGYLANLGIPRSGEVLRGATAAGYEDIPFEKVFGTIIAERAVDVLMVLIIVIIAIALHTDELFALFDEFQINPWVSLIGVLVLILFGVLFLRFIKRSKLRFFVKIKKFARGILQGVKSIFHMENNILFILHTIFIWGMYILTFYILKFAFPGTAGLSFGAMLVAFVIGSFSVSVTNGGMGIYPIAVGAALALFGISKEMGEAFGWFDWGTQTLLNIVAGGLSLILLPILNRTKRPKNHPPEDN